CPKTVGGQFHSRQSHDIHLLNGLRLVEKGQGSQRMAPRIAQLVLLSFDIEALTSSVCPCDLNDRDSAPAPSSDIDILDKLTRQIPKIIEVDKPCPGQNLAAFIGGVLNGY